MKHLTIVKKFGSWKVRPKEKFFELNINFAIPGKGGLQNLNDWGLGGVNMHIEMMVIIKDGLN